MWPLRCFPFNSVPSDSMWHAQCCYADLNWLLTSHQSARPRHRANAAVSCGTGMTHTHTCPHKDTNKLPTRHTNGDKWPIFLSANMIHLWVSVNFSCGLIPCLSPSTLLPLTLLYSPSCCSALSGDYDFKLRKWKPTGSLYICQKFNE